MSFRGRTVMVTTAHHEALRAYAAAHNLSCPDEAAELLLGERFESDPLLTWIALEYAKAMTDLRKRTQERIEGMRP